MKLIQKGKYQYDTRKQPLGGGSYGKVYQGTNNENKTAIAIKAVPTSLIRWNSKMNPDEIYKKKKLKEQLLSEVQCLREQAKLDCPYIQKFHECAETKSFVYIISELCNNGNLLEFQTNLAQKGQKLAEESAVEILYQIALGLSVVHNTKKIVHRDLKPANIFINDKVFKIGDFGFAKEASKISGTLCGSNLYMAPEQFEHNDPVHHTTKIDIWSFGVMADELLVQRPRNSMQNIISDARDGKYIIPSFVKISDQAHSFLKSCLTKDYKERLSMQQLLQHPLFDNIRDHYDSTIHNDLIDKILGEGGSLELKQARVRSDEFNSERAKEYAEKHEAMSMIKTRERLPTINQDEELRERGYSNTTNLVKSSGLVVSGSPGEDQQLNLTSQENQKKLDRERDEAENLCQIVNDQNAMARQKNPANNSDYQDLETDVNKEEPSDQKSIFVEDQNTEPIPKISKADLIAQRIDSIKKKQIAYRNVACFFFRTVQLFLETKHISEYSSYFICKKACLKQTELVGLENGLLKSESEVLHYCTKEDWDFWKLNDQEYSEFYDFFLDDLDESIKVHQDMYRRFIKKYPPKSDPYEKHKDIINLNHLEGGESKAFDDVMKTLLNWNVKNLQKKVNDSSQINGGVRDMMVKCAVYLSLMERFDHEREVTEFSLNFDENVKKIKEMSVEEKEEFIEKVQSGGCL